jgi:hypothetical protein
MLVVPRIRMSAAVTSTQGIDRDNFLPFSFFWVGGEGTRSPVALSTVASVTVVGPEHLDLSWVLCIVQSVEPTINNLLQL